MPILAFCFYGPQLKPLQDRMDQRLILFANQLPAQPPPCEQESTAKKFELIYYDIAIGSLILFEIFLRVSELPDHPRCDIDTSQGLPRELMKILSILFTESVAISHLFAIECFALMRTF